VVAAPSHAPTRQKKKNADVEAPSGDEEADIERSQRSHRLQGVYGERVQISVHAPSALVE
jgi:hypothetical protein